MKRLSLLLAMLALLSGMALVVVTASPYAPVVAPAPENIEDIWAIEDARTESAVPLVTALDNHGMRLGYDAQENTFYCPIGLENGDEWPQLHLTAPGNKRLKLVMADDYSYDWCSDALRDGYAYQLLAYTDTEFAYAQIVFTGVPVVTIETDGEIGYEDSAAQVTYASPAGGFATRAIAHLRGAGSRTLDKKGYKVSFVRGAKDSDAIVDVPGLGQADDVVLLPGVMDNSLTRDRLSWALWGMMADEKEPYGPRDTQYAEVFVNDRYMGCYIVMQPFDAVEELAKRAAGAASTDSVYRTAQIDYAGDRPYAANAMREGSIYDLHHAPDAAHAFDALRAYLALEQEEDDEAFEQMALGCIDMASILRYYLLIQAGGMSDNVYNNMYIIASRAGGGVTYRFAPWDMDLTWGRAKKGDEFWHDLFSFEVCQRMIDIDAGGVTRKALASMWNELREEVFDEENVQALVDAYTHELDASGAYMRDAVRWRGEAFAADGYEIVTFAGEHFAAMDAYIASLVE